jgi:hypothetical protein
VDAKAPEQVEPKAGDVVALDGRQAVFLYRTTDAAIIRFEGEIATRAVPLSKLRMVRGREKRRGRDLNPRSA